MHRTVLPSLLLMLAGCDGRRVVTDVDVAFSVVDADGALLDPASSPLANTVLRTRSGCEDGDLTLCVCDDSAYAVVRLNYTGNGRFNAFDFALPKDRTTTSTGIDVQAERQAIRTAYPRGDVYRFGDENDLDSNDLVIVDDAATREDDVVTVSYPLDDGTSVTERHTIH
jgi:hypothetical protein